MEHEHFVLEIDGEENRDLYQDLVSVEIELDEDLIGMFRLKIALRLEQDGHWTYLDDDLFKIWKPVAIRAGFNGEADDLFSGYITHLKPYFDPDLSHCTLEVWGMDNSILMDRIEQLKDWASKKDSDIATEILGDVYGLTPHVEETQVVHEEAVSTIIQRETDWQFLKRLARRNGYEVYIEGDNGYFRPPRLDDSPQPVLAAQFGAETNVKSIAIEVNALVPSNISMSQIDRASKEVLDSSAESSEQTALGSTDASGLLTSDVDPAQVIVNANVTTGSAEMLALCQAIYHQSEWFVTAEGEIDANAYGHVLLPHRPVLIKGLGETYSGTYYLVHVVHSFTSNGYAQRFRAKRNGLGLTGDEDFGGGGGGLLGSLL